MFVFKSYLLIFWIHQILRLQRATCPLAFPTCSPMMNQDSVSHCHYLCICTLNHFGHQLSFTVHHALASSRRAMLCVNAMSPPNLMTSPNTATLRPSPAPLRPSPAPALRSGGTAFQKVAKWVCSKDCKSYVINNSRNAFTHVL
jgi:hypothetical protein